MSLLSLNFLAVIVGAKIALSLRLPAAAKTFILLLVSCAFALSYLSHFQFVALLAFCLFAYCAAVVSARKPSWIFSTLFSVWSLLGIYLYLKGYLKFLPNINKEVPAAGLAGLSYILFRVVLVHLEFTSKRLSPPSPVRYLLYLFYFPSFASGPVQAYPDFSAQLSGREKAPTAWVGPFFRVAMGLAKIYLISRWFDTAAEMLPKERLEGISIEALDVFLSISGICYFFHLYINFSGYMDVVVGISRWFGIKIPENFNEPLLAKNFLDFWKRWHITVSDWFRDYVFSPLYKWAAGSFARRHRAWHVYLAIACSFVSFVLMGLWHGTHFRHAMYGVLLGAGVALPQLWKILVQKSKLGPYPMPSLLGRAFTMSYFSAALFLIRPDFNEIRAHMPTLGGEADLETAVIYVVAWLLVLIAYDALALVRDYARENWERLGFARAPLISIGAAAAIYFLFLYGAFLKGSAVTLLYAAF